MKTGLSVSLMALALAGFAACAPVEEAEKPVVEETETVQGPADQLALKTLPEIADALAAGEVTSEALVEAYIKRIDTIDRAGPTLQSVLALNPNALEDARKADEALANGDSLGPLHGVPILLKDNIESADPVATTAGAYALRNNMADKDSPLVKGLRDAGAIILGKTNLSQWANFRSGDSISGWSAMGGQVRNPHMLDRTPCGSSSGSGAAAAAYLAAGTVGTETNGSIICPSTSNGIVGFKPTVGLVAQDGIVPISSTQDTAGPMTRSVRGAAMMLNAMATGEGKTDYVAGLNDTALNGKRIGVLRFAEGSNEEVVALYYKALEVLKAQGAELVDINELDIPNEYWRNEGFVLRAEFKDTLNKYLASTDPREVPVRTLEELIAFNEANAGIELFIFDQSIFEESQEQPDLDDEGYLAAVEGIVKAAGENGIDKMLADFDVEMVVSPSRGPAFMIDAVNGDTFGGGGAGAGHLAAVAGYPHITVPMGTVRGLPVGLSFMGTAGDDANVLAAGYDYEQATNLIAEPQFHINAEGVERVALAMRPFKQ